MQKGSEERQENVGGKKTPLRAFRFIHAFKHLTFHQPLVIKALCPLATSPQ